MKQKIETFKAKMPWTKIRFILEKEFLCEKLNGRVTYFATKYRASSDKRVSIRIDGIEMISMSYYALYDFHHEATRAFKEKKYNSFEEAREDITKKHHDEGIYSSNNFGDSFDEYFYSSIGKSLGSKDYLVRVFAVLDRRVGKRTLIELRKSYSTLPEWVKPFYKLRLNIEDIIIEDKYE